MPRQSEKAHLLDSSGYAYNFERMMYINRQAKKAFSYEFIDDNPTTVIASHIEEPADEEWRFYTSLPISEGTRKELKKVLQ